MQGRADSFKYTSRTRQGRISSAIVLMGERVSEAHSSQPTRITRNELWKTESKDIGDQHQLLEREKREFKEREREALRGPAGEAGKGKREICEKMS